MKRYRVNVHFYVDAETVTEAKEKVADVIEGAQARAGRPVTAQILSAKELRARWRC